jgi:hypothetical protein
MNAPLGLPSSIVKSMVEQRRLAALARCRVKEWHVTGLQAWQLADEIRHMQREFNEAPKYLCEIVESMKVGNISVLGAKVVVR